MLQATLSALQMENDPRCAAIVETFRATVASATDEKPIQRFLEEHPFVLPHSATHVARRVVIPQFPLIDRFVPDFAYIAYNSAGCWLRLIEIESPTKQIFREDNHFREPYRTALQQTSDWLDWCRTPENFAIIRRRLKPLLDGTITPESLSVECVFVCGRRSELSSPERKRRYRELVKQNDLHTEIMTYDRMLDNMHAAFWRIEQIRCVRFHNEDSFAASLADS